jgi:hypothetical protein
MGWDELLVDWERALDEIESALAAGNWQALEDITWPVPDDVSMAPDYEQRMRAAALSDRQRDAASRIATMLEGVGRELRESAATRDAVHAYEAAGRHDQGV